MATTLRVAELDFDTIKSNLKEFLRSKPEFTDYDYEGSGLSVLMDLLSYNTHYNAVIANMLVQEMYLDTAVKAQSLALIAKRLGYTPKSIRAPRAVVSMEVFPTGAPSSITLLKNSKFSSRVTYNQNFTFINRDAITVERNIDGRYIFDAIELYEGDNTTFQYLVTNPVIQKFEIPTPLVDASLVRVYVKESSISTDVTEWKRFDTIIGVDEATNCYFVKLNENLKYEIYFGDGIIGKQIVPGNVIIIDYVATNGPVANNVSAFMFADSIGNTSNATVTTVVSAYGGADAETLDSVRVNAQNRVLSQNRAVTESDYISVISNMLPIDTINVYGGETVTPPQYGKVFISVKLTNSTLPLTSAQKDDVIVELKKRSVVALLHEFIDPEYSYIIIDTKVRFNPQKTTLSASTLKTSVFNKLVEYGNTTLNKFNSTFEYSRLVTYIDTADKSIISNDTTIRLRKEVPFVHNFDNVYEWNFYTPLTASNNRETNIISSTFRLTTYPDNDMLLTDDNGVIKVFYILNNQRIFLTDVFGSVDYNTGKISISLKTINEIDTMFAITILPADKNVLPTRNNILTLKESDVTISIVQ